VGRLEAVNRQSLPLTVFLSFTHKDPVNYAIPSGIAAFLAVFGIAIICLGTILTIRNYR
jgi:hypothetical protein